LTLKAKIDGGTESCASLTHSLI